MLSKNSVQQALNIEIDVSSAMTIALQQWTSMYINEATWLNTYVKSLNLPAAIAGEIARAVTIELEVTISGSARADFLAEQFGEVVPHLRGLIEYGNAKGGLMFKPYIVGDGITVDYVQADQFYPVSFDANGDIVACVFSDQRKIGDSWYTRLEYHSFTDEGYFVKNAAFKGTTKSDLGSPVPLDSVDAWSDLAEEATISGLDRPLFAYFKYPSANNIDPTSPLGVSCYARAVDLIQQADQQWSDLLWELDSAKRVLFLDDLAFDKDSDGKPILPNQRLYRILRRGGGVDDNLFEEWSPDIREENLLNVLDATLKKVEFNCGLAYGTISDPATVDKTATEIVASRQRSAATVVDSQKALERTLNHLLYAMDIWATLGKLATKGTYEIVYAFDDSIVTDRDAQFSHDTQTVGMSAMPKTQFLIRNYGLTEEVAQEWITDAAAEQPEDLFEE